MGPTHTEMRVGVAYANKVVIVHNPVTAYILCWVGVHVVFCHIIHKNKLWG